MTIQISKIKKEELHEVMLKWSKKMGWLYSEYDLESYYALNGNQIFSLKYIDESLSKEELIGCISRTRYLISCEKNIFLFFIGLFIINENYRGKKIYGPALWQTVVTTLENEFSNFIISLNSVPKVISYYKKHGLSETCFLSNHYSAFFKTEITLTNGLPNYLQILNWNKENEEMISVYENSLFSRKYAERDRFRSFWLSRPDAVILAYIQNKKIEGYAVLTLCDLTEKIYRLSPCYSNSIDVAHQILNGIKFIFNNQHVKIDVNALTNNSFVKNLLEDHEFSLIEGGDSQLMSNQPLNNNENLIEKIIGLGPLEFPHELILHENSMGFSPRI